MQVFYSHIHLVSSLSSSGLVSQLSGLVSQLSGLVSQLSRLCFHCLGCASAVSGDVSQLSGNISQLSGDVSLCDALCGALTMHRSPLPNHIISHSTHSSTIFQSCHSSQSSQNSMRNRGRRLGVSLKKKLCMYDLFNFASHNVTMWDVMMCK